MPIRTPDRSSRHWLRWLLLGAALLALAAGLVILLPSTPWGRRVLIGAIQHLFNGRLRADRWQIAWFKPVQAEGVRLEDRDGRTAVDARRFSLERTVFQLVWHPGDLGTITLERPAFHLARTSGGRLNLFDCIRVKERTRSLVFRLDRASVEFRDPRAGVSLAIQDLDARFTLPRGDAPIGFALDGRVTDPGIDAWRAMFGTATLALRGSIEPRAGRLVLDRTAVHTDWLDLDLAGRLDDYHDRKLARLHGRVSYTGRGASERMAMYLAPEVPLADADHEEVTIEGSLRAATWLDVLRQLRGHMNLALRPIEAHGLSLGPAVLSMHLAHGCVVFDPIETTLNGGWLTLQPTIRWSGQGPEVVLDSGSRLDGARIDPALCHRLLQYAAPMLSRVASADGQVTIELHHGRIPLQPEPFAAAELDGRVHFVELRFGSSPLVESILSAVGSRWLGRIVIDQTVGVKLFDGRVSSDALRLPLGALGTVEISGSVGLDQTLDLIASVPLTSTLLARQPRLAEIVEGQFLDIPIRGTLRRPAIDRDRMKSNLKQLALNSLPRAVGTGLEILGRVIEHHRREKRGRQRDGDDD